MQAELRELRIIREEFRSQRMTVAPTERDDIDLDEEEDTGAEDWIQLFP